MSQKNYEHLGIWYTSGYNKKCPNIQIVNQLMMPWILEEVNEFVTITTIWDGHLNIA